MFGCSRPLANPCQGMGLILERDAVVVLGFSALRSAFVGFL